MRGPLWARTGEELADALAMLGAALEEVRGAALEELCGAALEDAGAELVGVVCTNELVIVTERLLLAGPPPNGMLKGETTLYVVVKPATAAWLRL